MGKYSYRFEAVRGNEPIASGPLWAWMWGNWKIRSKWTSISARDADFSTENAQKGLKGAKSLLTLAIPSSARTPFGVRVEQFDVVRVLTFEEGKESNTPFRTAMYRHAKVLSDPVPRDFSRIPNVGQS